MEPWKKAIVAIAAAAAVIATVVAVGSLAGWFGAPYVVSIENRWGDVSSNEMRLVTSVTIENPNPFPVTISSLRYRILLNNVTMAGGYDTDVTLQDGTTDLDYVTGLNMSRIPRWWSSHIARDETTRIELVYTVRAGIGPLHRSYTSRKTYDTIDTDLLSMLHLSEPRNITVSIGGQDRRLLVATDFAARWGTITDGATVINATVDLYNPHGSTVTVNTFTYYFTMNGVTVGSGSLGSSVPLPPRRITSVAVDTVIDSSDLIDWFTIHVRNNETTRYEIGGSATFTFNGQRHTAEPVHLTGMFTTDLLG